jgi:hypothetical protein
VCLPLLKRTRHHSAADATDPALATIRRIRHAGRTSALKPRTQPDVCDLPHIGTEVASQLLVVTVRNNPDRLGNEAKFAALFGVAPIPGSGKTTRQQFTRGGDRNANHALYQVVLQWPSKICLRERGLVRNDTLAMNYRQWLTDQIAKI